MNNPVQTSLSLFALGTTNVWTTLNSLDVVRTLAKLYKSAKAMGCVHTPCVLPTGPVTNQGWLAASAIQHLDELCWVGDGTTFPQATYEFSALNSIFLPTRRQSKGQRRAQGRTGWIDVFT